jgi:NAD(P)-dependent dehydrogenase (short-subunit alcohol dehydrogenase family)
LIESAIEKLIIAGPNEVFCGGEQCELTVYLTDKDGQHRAADWDRHIDLNVSGGMLSAAQLVIRKGERKGVVKYSPAGNAGKYVLTASSLGISDGSYTIGVVYQAYVLTIFALLGGLAGGIGRQLKADKKFSHILPHRTRKKWDMGCVGRLAGSVLSAFFLYWAFKLGLSQAFGSPVLPVSLDLGTRIVAFLFGGIGGFAGIAVLELLTAWLVPGTKPQTAPAQ